MGARRVGVILALACACGGDGEGAARSTTPAATETEATRAAAAYELHEWGVLSRTPRGVELAAGPGTRPELLTVDKPVVYVHAEAPLSLQLGVELGEGWTVAERWPGEGELAWTAEVTPGACEEQIAFPTSCAPVDGYCESAELANYVAPDADCLRVAGAPAPLLFYRLRGGDVLDDFPVEVDAGRARTSRGRGTAWRVRFQGGEVRAARFEVGPEWTAIPEPSQPVTAARDALHADLQRLGLSEGERAAFERAWWEALFGAAAATMTDSEDEDGDAPVRDRRSLDSLSDGLVADETMIEDLPGAPRVPDALLYWLDDPAIDRIARLRATPEPAAIRRAFLVRHQL